VTNKNTTLECEIQDQEFRKEFKREYSEFYIEENRLRTRLKEAQVALLSPQGRPPLR